jgi:competence protein ComEC
MSFFLSFIYGTSFFYIHRFFPYTSLLISLILLSLLVLGDCPRITGKAVDSGLSQKIREKFAVIVIAVIAVSGFYGAKMRYVQPLSLSHIAGETIELRGVPNSEAIPLDSESYQGVAAFSQKIEVREPENLKEIRLISDKILPSDRIYNIKAHIPKDAYSLNPGGNHNILSGYAVEIKEAGSNHNGFFKELRTRLNKFIKGNFSPESAPFLMSITTGERSLLTKETRDAFNATGLAHILSISGAHFGLLMFVLFGLFRFLVKALPYTAFVRLTLYLTPSQIAAILCVPFMIGYLGISDMSIPSIRSFIMITLFLSGLLIHRKGFWLNTLLFAAAVIILIQPDSVLDLSFQLSFVAVLCIGLVTEQNSGRSEDRKLDNDTAGYQSSRAAERLEQFKRFKRFKLLFITLLRYCTSALKISLAATIATAPLVTYYFHYFSLVSPVTNLIITPVIGFVILPLSLVSSFVFLASGIFPFSSFIDAVTVLVLDVIRHIAQWSFVDIKIPAFPPILLAMFYLGIIVYLIIEQRAESKEQIRPIALLITISVVPIVIYACIKIFEHKGIKITYLDVGQGDSAVVELPDKRTLVIDTGRKGFQAGGFLKYRGIENIDAVVLSHGQSDHAGGIFHLLRNFNIHEIWDNGRLIYPKTKSLLRIRKLQRGDVIEGSGYRIIVLHPHDGFYTMHSKGSDENNDCIVLKIQGNKNAFLFAGDIEEEAEEDLSYLGEHLKSNVMKVSHHGSRTSASEIFLNAVSPQIAVISVGRKNPYNHPHCETLDMLDGAKIFRTDIDGAIGISELSDGRLEIKTWRGFQMHEAKTIRDEMMNFKKLFMVW